MEEEWNYPRPVRSLPAYSALDSLAMAPANRGIKAVNTAKVKLSATRQEGVKKKQQTGGIAKKQKADKKRGVVGPSKFDVQE
jgi:hypothetical protein